MVGILNIGEVNGLDTEQFVWMFGNVVESYKDAATSVAEKKPFRNVNHLCKLFSEHLENLPREGNIFILFYKINVGKFPCICYIILEKLKVLCLHPDLAGRLADEGELTPESTREQKAAELNAIDPKQKAKINRFNTLYVTLFQGWVNYFRKK